MEQQNRKHLSDHYAIRRLKQGECIKSFNCGDADLNDFILNRYITEMRYWLLAIQ